MKKQSILDPKKNYTIEELEKIKLLREIAETERYPLFRPTYLGIIIPFIAALILGFITYYTTTTSKEKAENERLEALLTELRESQNTYRLESLETKEDTLSARNSLISKKLAKYDTHKLELVEDINRYKSKLEKMKKDSLNLSAEVKKQNDLLDDAKALTKRVNSNYEELLTNYKNKKNKLDSTSLVLDSTSKLIAKRELIVNYYKLAIDVIWLTMPTEGFLTKRFNFKRTTSDEIVLLNIRDDINYLKMPEPDSILRANKLDILNNLFISDLATYLGVFKSKSLKDNLEYFNNTLHPRWDILVRGLDPQNEFYIDLN